MATTPFLQHGAAPEKPTRFAPIWTNRFFTGLWTQRNPLRDAATPYIYEKFYSGSRYESLIGGLNCEISNRLTLIRRPGCGIYNSATVGSINRFYSFRQFTGSTETISVYADSGTSQGAILDVTTSGSAPAIIGKGIGAGTAYFQSVGNVLYIGDGVDQIKWASGTAGYQKYPWGVSISGNTATPIATASVGTNIGNGVPWVNPNNVNSSTAFSTVTLTSGQTSQGLLASLFGFSGIFAGAVPSGITVYFTVASTGPSLRVQLSYNGAPLGSPKSVPNPGSSVVTIPLGSATDMWNIGPVGSLTAAQVNSSTFGVVFTASGGAGTVSIQNVRMQINLTSAPVATPGGTGSLSTTNGGWSYVQAYSTSTTGAVSNASPASASTGNFSGKASVTVTLTPPAFTAGPGEALYTHVYRTTDGGSTYFELPNSPVPASSTSIVDTATDAQLNKFSQAVIDTSNTPPPNGLINLAYHNNRMWGSVGNIVFYSGAPNATAGNGVENFPPLNSFVFPSLVTKLVPHTIGMLVLTVSEPYVILGNGTASSPYFSTILAYKIGLLHYDALTAAGTFILMMTGAGEVIKFDPSAALNALTGLASAYLEKIQIGFPIGDVLQNTYNPAKAFVTWHHAGSLDQALYVADGSIGWYRWIETTTPEGTPAWAPQAQITGGCGCVQSVETSPGVYKLLIAPVGTGQILYRSLTNYMDNISPYTWFATVGSIVLAQPGQVAEIDFVTTDCNGSGTNVTVSWLRDEISGPFTALSTGVPDPTYLPESATAPGQRYYFEQTGDPTIARHIQLQFGGAAADTTDELLAYTINGAVRAEK